ISQFKPDLIFLLQYSSLPFLVDNSYSIKQILGEEGKIAFWLVDLEPRVYANKILGKFINFFFLTNAGQIKEYQKKWGVKNVYFMPQGCFIAKNFPSSRKRVFDLGFLGRRQREDRRYKQRNKILDSFKKKFGLIESDKNLTLTGQINFYQKCKIIIGSSWRNDVYLYSSDRIFNVLGAGSFYLCSYFPGIEKLFKNHYHLVWFKTISEGHKLASYYLNHETEREKIAYNGYKLVKEKHTYLKRIENIFKIINGETNQFLGFL
ncbi:MAG: glycosyltransferase family protein, partial [Minisyncoccia bacterium]